MTLRLGTRLLVMMSILPHHLAAQTPAEIAAARYEFDPQHSSIAFTSRILGAVRVPGRFQAYEGSVIFDPAHLTRSSVTVVIDASSLTTDMSFRDNHLRSPDFFDVKQFPSIEFTSDSISGSGNDFVVTGKLLMHGVSQNVRVPLHVALWPDTAKPSGTVRMGFEGALKISRAQFGIAGTNRFNASYDPASTLLADSVEISLDIFAIRPGYATRKLGTGTPPGVSDTLYRTIGRSGMPRAEVLYRSLQEKQPDAYNYGAGQLDLLGHFLVAQGRLADAVEIFRLNAEVHGTTPGVLESLGEAQALANDRAASLATFRRALLQAPGSTMAREMIRRLEATPR